MDTQPGLICPHGHASDTTCLTCRAEAKLCPHGYANPLSCMACTVPSFAARKAHRRGRPTPTPPPIRPNDCDICGFTPTQCARANALVPPDSRHTYTLKRTP